MGRVRSLFGSSPRLDRRPRSRLPLHRRPFADPVAYRRWLVAGALALAVAMATSHLLSTAAAARHRWGDTRTVLVTRHPVKAGDGLTGATEKMQWPIALIPEGTLTRLPTDARSVGALAGGMPITEAALVRAGGGGRDRKRIAVATNNARLPLRPGDRVDVWATVDPSLAGTDLTTRRIAVAALVTSATPRTVVVAVRAREVPGVAEAVALATVTLAASG